MVTQMNLDKISGSQKKIKTHECRKGNCRRRKHEKNEREEVRYNGVQRKENIVYTFMKCQRTNVIN